MGGGERTKRKRKENEDEINKSKGIDRWEKIDVRSKKRKEESFGVARRFRSVRRESPNEITRMARCVRGNTSKINAVSRGSENRFSKNSRSKKRSLFLFVFFFSFEEDEEKTSVSFERVLRDHRRNSHRLPPPRASVIVRVIGRGMRDTRSYYML